MPFELQAHYKSGGSSQKKSNNCMLKSRQEDKDPCCLFWVKHNVTCLSGAPHRRCSTMALHGVFIKKIINT